MSNNASNVHVIEEEDDFVPPPPIIDDDDDLSDIEIPPLIPFERQNTIKIIIAEKKNAPQPRCSFCREPFKKLTTSSISVATVLTDWAEKSFSNDAI